MNASFVGSKASISACHRVLPARTEVSTRRAKLPQSSAWKRTRSSSVTAEGSKSDWKTPIGGSSDATSDEANFVGELELAVRAGLARGFATRKRCLQCWQHKPAEAFRSLATGFPISWCTGCQTRYRGWAKKTDDERASARRAVPRTGNGYTVRLVLRSLNRKTGPIPVSSTDMASCPSTCPHKDSGCYAGYGHAGSHWARVATEGVSWAAFLEQVRELPEGTLWRHNEAGDLPGLGDKLDRRALGLLVGANLGRRGFTFTHKHRSEGDLRSIAAANELGLTINLSADSLAEADRLADLNAGPVAVVLPAAAPDRAQRTPAGRVVVVCPAETKAALTCATCGLCAIPTRKAIVGFRAHGQAKRRVSLRVLQGGSHV